MPNPTISALIARQLTDGLVHPGDAQRPPIAIPLHAFRTGAIPPDQQQHFATDAGIPPGRDFNLLVAEAIVHLIETDGHATIKDNAELAQLEQDAADAPDGTRIIAADCPNHGKPWLELTIGKADRIPLSCTIVATALTAHHGGAA